MKRDDLSLHVDTQEVPAKSRIVLIDSLRGYALMGLFMVHMVEYFELYWYHPQESVFNDFTFGVFGGKSYAIFALLFGVSFSIISENRQQQGMGYHALITWRFCLLLLAGLCHGLLYGGDILQILAICGLILLPLYKVPHVMILVLSAILLLQIPFITFTILHIYSGSTDYPQPLHWTLYGAVYEIYAHGSISELVHVNITKAPIAKWTFMFESGRISTILGMTLLGFWCGKTGVLKASGRSLRMYGIYLCIALLFAITLYISKSQIALLLKAEQYWMSKALLGSYIELSITFVSVFAFAFLFQIRSIQQILSKLAPCGKMSLTLYLCQSILFIPLFYGFGLGAYAYIGQTYSFLIGILFCIIHIWIANYWVKRYHYGPFEWLWRSATYRDSNIKFRKINN